MTAQHIVTIKISEEYSKLLPALSEEEYNGLKNSIQEEGQHYAIILNENGIILDGYHRYKICKELGIQPKVEIKKFDDLLLEKKFVIESNLHRRHLQPFQKVELGYPLLEIEREQAKQRRTANLPNVPIEPFGDKGRATSQVANKIGVSRTTFERGIKIIEEAPEETKEKLRKGKKTIYAVYKNLKHQEKIEELKQQIPRLKLPKGKFQVIVADPPWPYGTSYDAEGRRGVGAYPEENIENIKKEPIPKKADENCVLWLWTTNAFMHNAFHVLEAWGFEPKTILTWVKNKFGVGTWLRGQTEHCILAIKGNPIVDLTNQATVLFADVRKHSEKPDEFYNMVSSLCIGRKLDYFATKEREGWEVFGTKELDQND